MKRSMAFLTAVVLCFGPLAAMASQGRPPGAGRPSSPPSAPASPSRPTMPDRPAPSAGKSTNPGTDKAGSKSDHGKTTEELLAKNTKLSSKLQTLVGRDPQVACAGFKNLGDCVSAAHVSNNLGISFDELKRRTTGTDAKSLGNAIHELNPNVDAKAEVKKAKGQAVADMKKPS